MKLFLLKTIILFTFAAMSVLIIISLSPIKKNYNSAMVEKLKILQANKSKSKILLIGGSSVGWGLSAEQIQKATKITTINLGHHAGFGLIDYQDFILHCTSPGDIVVFSPEWNFYENPDFFDTATLQDLQLNTEYLELTNKSHSFPFYAGLRRKIISLPNPIPYTFDCINKNGDVISHCGLRPKGAENYTVNLTNFNLEIFIKKFEYISKSKCVLLFPPTQKRVYEKHKKEFDKLQIVICESQLNYIDSIVSNVYCEEEFYDANYHLNCETRNRRTEKVINYITKYLSPLNLNGNQN